MISLDQEANKKKIHIYFFNFLINLMNLTSQILLLFELSIKSEENEEGVEKGGGGGEVRAGGVEGEGGVGGARLLIIFLLECLDILTIGNTFEKVLNLSLMIGYVGFNHLIFLHPLSLLPPIFLLSFILLLKLFNASVKKFIRKSKKFKVQSEPKVIEILGGSLQRKAGEEVGEEKIRGKGDCNLKITKTLKSIKISVGTEEREEKGGEGGKGGGGRRGGRGEGGEGGGAKTGSEGWEREGGKRKREYDKKMMNGIYINYLNLINQWLNEAILVFDESLELKFANNFAFSFFGGENLKILEKYIFNLKENEKSMRLNSKFLHEPFAAERISQHVSSRKLSSIFSSENDNDFSSMLRQKTKNLSILVSNRTESKIALQRKSKSKNTILDQRQKTNESIKRNKRKTAKFNDFKMESSSSHNDSKKEKVKNRKSPYPLNRNGDFLSPFMNNFQSRNLQSILSDFFYNSPKKYYNTYIDCQEPPSLTTEDFELFEEKEEEELKDNYKKEKEEIKNRKDEKIKREEEGRSNDPEIRMMEEEGTSKEEGGKRFEEEGWKREEERRKKEEGGKRFEEDGKRKEEDRRKKVLGLNFIKCQGENGEKFAILRFRRMEEEGGLNGFMKNETKSNFLNTLCHELRTPINCMMNMLEMIQDQVDDVSFTNPLPSTLNFQTIPPSSSSPLLYPLSSSPIIPPFSSSHLPSTCIPPSTYLSPCLSTFPPSPFNSLPSTPSFTSPNIPFPSPLPPPSFSPSSPIPPPSYPPLSSLPPPSSLIPASTLLPPSSQSPPLFLSPKQELENCIKKALVSSKLLLSVINDFLDYFSISCQIFRLQVCEFELEKMLFDCVGVFEFLAEQRNIEIVLEFDQKIPKMVRTDEKRLMQIIFNLLSMFK